MKKILVPTIDWPVSSDAAYRIAEIADAIQANLIVLFIAQKVDGNSYRRGNLSIEIIEEATQDYNFEIDGFVVTGDPAELISRMATKFEVDLILLGATEENDWNSWRSKIGTIGNCSIQLLDSFTHNLDPDLSR